jgi:WD40 repeat protein
MYSTHKLDDSTILWDLITGVKIREIRLHDGGVIAIAVHAHASGPMIVTGGVDSSAAICNFTLRKRSRKWTSDTAQRDSIAVTSIKVYSMPIQRISSSSTTKIRSSFRPGIGEEERTLIVVGCQDGKIRVFDMISLATVATLSGHKSRINALSVSINQPAGQYYLV